MSQKMLYYAIHTLAAAGKKPGPVVEDRLRRQRPI